MNYTQQDIQDIAFNSAATDQEYYDALLWFHERRMDDGTIGWYLDETRNFLSHFQSQGNWSEHARNRIYFILRDLVFAHFE